MIQGTSAMDQPLVRRRFPRRRALPWVVGALALSAAGAFAYPTLHGWMSAERSADLSRLRVSEVVRGDLERDLSVQGRVVAAFHPTAFSPASGIVAVKIQAGAVVEEGQVLAVVDSPELNSRLKQEQSTLQSLVSELERQRILAKQAILTDRQKIDLAEVELEAGQRAMDRAERSRREGIVNEVDYETAQDNLHRARLALDHGRQSAALQEETLDVELHNRELSVERQRLVVGELTRQVDDLTIRAPVAGLVSRLDVDDHDAVTPGQPVATVVDLSAFEVEIQVPENYADDIGPGTPAEIHSAGRTYDGRVRIVSPEVSGSQVLGSVVFTGEVPEGLRQNQRVTTRLVLESKSDVLKVARGPFLEEGGGRRAYVVDGNTALLRPIRIGSTSVSEVEILSGLEAGDRIVISDTTRFGGAERVFLRQ